MKYFILNGISDIIIWNYNWSKVIYQLTEKLFTLFRKYCLGKSSHFSNGHWGSMLHVYVQTNYTSTVVLIYIVHLLCSIFLCLAHSWTHHSYIIRIDFWERNLKEYMLHCLNVTVWKPHWLGWYSYLNSSIQGMCIL